MNQTIEVILLQGKWLSSLQIAAVYVGTVVGAGFATGKEIVEFFTQYGTYGFLGVAISGFLFIWIGTKMMFISIEIGSQSYQEFNRFLFGKKLSWLVNLMMFLILLGVTSVMLSGAGAIFEERLHLPYQLGVLVTIFLTFIVMIKGVKGLVGVNIIVVPMMILFSLVLAGKAVLNDPIEGIFSLQAPSIEWKWLLSSFSYAAFNLAMAQAVLVPLANEIKDKEVIKWGGIIGGTLLSLILLSGHIALLTVPDVHHFEIPMAEIMKGSMSAFYGVYIITIYGEIFTSVIGDIFGLERQLRTIIPLKSYLLIGGILVVAYSISLVGYGSLISLLYPVFGYVSLVLLFLLMIRRIPS